jgi:hypothetical protein
MFVSSAADGQDVVDILCLPHTVCSFPALVVVNQRGLVAVRVVPVLASMSRRGALPAVKLWRGRVSH